MKNKTVNRKIIRAISIGLSAVMATSPMTAMAAEPAAAGAEPAVGSSQTTETLEQQVAGVEAAASELTKDDENGKGEVKKAADAEAAAAELATAEGTAKPVEDAGKNLQNETTEVVTGESQSVNSAQNSIEGVEDNLDDAKDAAKEVTDAMNTAEDKVEAAEGIAAGAAQVVEDAEQDVQENIQEIENAGTEAEAEAARNAAQSAVDAAQTALDAAHQAYQAAEADYNAAVAAAEQAAAEYEAALAAADTGSEEALAELAAAKQAAAELAQAAEAELAKAKLSEADAAALAIIEKENEIANGKQKAWNDLDSLFGLIMNNYYIPNEMNLPEGTTIQLDSKFTKFKDDDKNYLKATITDASGTREVYYNYKLEADGKSLIIFEKTWEDVVTAPEQYVVYSEGTTIARSIPASELQTKLESKEIVQGADGKYYAKALNENNEIAGSISSTTTTLGNNQTVVADSEETSYAVNQDGEIVKTVTGDVTTVTTVNGVSLSGGSGYASAEAAEAAAEAEAAGAMGEGDQLVGVDATVTVNADATATVTYITTFTTKIDLTGMSTKVEGRLSESQGAAEATGDIEDKAEERVDDFFSEGNYILLDTTFDGVNVERTKDEDASVTNWFPEDTYTVTSGTLSVTYAKLTTKKIDKWILEELLKGSQAGKDAIMKDAPAGSELVNYDVLDFSLGKATGTYLAGNTVTGTGSSNQADADTAKAEAEAAAKADAREKAQAVADALIDNSVASALQNKVNSGKSVLGTSANVVTSRANSTVSATVTGTEASYSYSGTYDKTNTSTAEDVVLATETWKADELTHVDEVKTPTLTNRNYENYISNGNASGIMLFEKTDENFLRYKQAALDAKAAVDAAKAKYGAIKSAAETAKSAVEAAATKVAELEAQIEALKGKADKTSEIAALNARLEVALEELNAADSKFSKLEELLGEAETAYEEALQRLTPEEGGEEEGNEEGGEEEGSDDDGEEDDETAGGAAPVVLANLPAGTVATVIPAPQPAAQPTGQTVVIDEEQTPLAPTAETEKPQGEVQTKEPQSEETVKIDDEQAPLADIFVEDEENKLNWWWLLIVAALGATGYEMHRRYQQKKAKAAAGQNSEDAE